jgi:hypothetical protein
MNKDVPDTLTMSEEEIRLAAGMDPGESGQEGGATAASGPSSDKRFGPKSAKTPSDRAAGTRTDGRATQQDTGTPDWPDTEPLGPWYFHRKPKPRVALLKTAAGALVLPAGNTAILIAEGGAGKTQAALQLCLSIATGRPWLETFHVARPGRVYLACAEEDQEEIHRRLHATASVLGLSDKERRCAQRLIHASGMSGRDVTLLEAGDRRVRRFDKTLTAHVFLEGLRCAGLEFRLIILDPASRFMPIEAETDNGVATRFVELLEELTKLPGNPTVVLTHHSNKEARKKEKGKTIWYGQNAARGSSALVDGCRWGAMLDVTESDDGERIDLRRTKTSYGPKWAGIALRRADHGVLVPIKTTLVTKRSAEVSDTKNKPKKTKSSLDDLDV